MTPLPLVQYHDSAFFIRMMKKFCVFSRQKFPGVVLSHVHQGKRGKCARGLFRSGGKCARELRSKCTATAATEEALLLGHLLSTAAARALQDLREHGGRGSASRLQTARPQRRLAVRITSTEDVALQRLLFRVDFSYLRCIL